MSLATAGMMAAATASGKMQAKGPRTSNGSGGGGGSGISQTDPDVDGQWDGRWVGRKGVLASRVPGRFFQW